MTERLKINPLIIYHANCADGFCAAWLFRKVFALAEFLPAQHGDKVPDVTDRDVFILDFSYPAEVLSDMIGKASSFVMLDHHETAQREVRKLDGMTFPLNGKSEIVFDMNKSGGRLAWEWLCMNYQETMIAKFPNICVRFRSPWIVDFTEDRDLWRHQYALTKEVNAYIRSFPLDFDLWDSWAAEESTADRFAEQGAAILRYQSKVIERHVSKAYETEIAGHKILAVNATTLNSEIAGELAKGRLFGAAYFCQQNQQVWSLRSDENGLNVAEIAEQFGGGGHKHAAGFQVSTK